MYLLTLLPLILAASPPTPLTFASFPSPSPIPIPTLIGLDERCNLGDESPTTAIVTTILPTSAPSPPSPPSPPPPRSTLQRRSHPPSRSKAQCTSSSTSTSLRRRRRRRLWCIPPRWRVRWR
ncbi:hypothetical protein I305_05176 [Cryptococcus gattii E566]|nr:hypothetical protein I305_05176 [Cryptococcus gattii E566]